MNKDNLSLCQSFLNVIETSLKNFEKKQHKEIYPSPLLDLFPENNILCLNQAIGIFNKIQEGHVHTHLFYKKDDNFFYGYYDNETRLSTKSLEGAIFFSSRDYGEGSIYGGRKEIDMPKQQENSFPNSYHMTLHNNEDHFFLMRLADFLIEPYGKLDAYKIEKDDLVPKNTASLYNIEKKDFDLIYFDICEFVPAIAQYKKILLGGIEEHDLRYANQIH